MVDDYFIIGNSELVVDVVKDYDIKLEVLLGRCRERGIKLNETKIFFKKMFMLYIGYLLIFDGVKVDFFKVEVIFNLIKFIDVLGVRRILGMINYLVKFLSNLFDVLELLR